MIEWSLILLAIGLYCCSSYLSYSDAWRRSPWLIPVGMSIGIVSSIAWFMLVKQVDDKQRIYFYSLIWDTIICSCFYIVPIIFFSVKIDRWSFLGLALMICGLVIIKLRAV